MLWLEAARNSRANSGNDLLIRGRHVGHPVCLEVPRRNIGPISSILSGRDINGSIRRWWTAE